MRKNPLRYVIIALCLLLAFVAEQVFGGDCCGRRYDDWRFRRSYFTHHVPRELQRQYYPPSRSAYRPAVVGNLPGFSVQGGFRINRININSGSSSDTTIFYEGFFRGR